MNEVFGQSFLDYDIFPEEIDEFCKLSVGDHLVISDTVGGFKHGIVASLNLLEVVDFSGVTQSEAEIKTVDLKKFMKKCGDFLIRLNHKKRLSGNETALRAIGMVNDKEEKWKKYNVIENNCEHFATTCVTGNEYSRRVSGFIDAMLRSSISGTGCMVPRPYE